MEFNNLGLYLFSIILILLGYISTSSFDYWKKRKIPYVTPWPIVGNFGRLLLRLETLDGNFNIIYKKFKNEKIVGFFMMKQPVLMIRDSELITDILIKNYQSFHDRWAFSYHVNKKLNPISINIIFATGDRWATLRRKISPGFSIGKLKSMFEQMKEFVDQFLNVIDDKVKSNNDIEILDICRSLTIDVIGSCAFGLDCNAMKDKSSDIKKYGLQVFESRFMDFVRAVVGSISTKLLVILNITNAPKDVSDFFFKLIQDSIKYRKENDVQRNDIFQQLIELQNSKYNPNDNSYFGEPKKSININENFDEVDVAAQAIILMLGGFETTASTMAFCLYELTLNQDIQNKTREEVRAAMEKHDGMITVEGLKDLTYLGMVIAETLRKHPPAGALPRICTQDYKIPGTDVTIQKGDKLYIPTASIHNDPKYYPNPEKFDPERFSKENQAARPSGQYIPFGDGPKYCMGKTFAEMEMKLVLSKLLSRYEFQKCAKTEIPVKLKMGVGLTIPENGIWLKVLKIND